MKRRLPAVVVVVAALVAVIVGTREPRDIATPTFSVSANGWMPAAPPSGGLTETWFCPGVPATGVDGVGGEIVIANRTGAQMIGTILLINTTTAVQRLALDVDGWASATVDLDDLMPDRIVGAVIEIEGGGAIVEQRSLNPAGDSVAACANATSDTWYLADGFTVDGSLDEIVLTNPFEQTVVVNLEFATRDGSRRPASYRGLTVPPRSVRVIDLGAPGAGAQSEPILAVGVEATRGRLVVGRSQTFLGGGRAGSQVTLAQPALREQWWFADGAKGDGVTERFSIYNPTDDQVEVDVIFIGIETPVVIDPLVVPAREAITFEPDSVDDLPDGPHAVVLATSTNEPAIVVEQAITRTDGETTATAVVAGAPPRQDGYLASTWYIGRSPSEPTTGAIVIHNGDLTDGTVSIFAIGASGPVPVPGLQDLPIPGSSFISVDLTDDAALGRLLVIESTARVFVERSIPTGRGGTRTSAWAVPAS